MTITIGQKLKQAREDQRLTFEKVFEVTRIRIQYLQALEADDLSVMPSPVQARGYLRNYAEYLGLNFDGLLDELRDANAQKPSEEVIGPADISPPQEILIPEPQPINIEVPVEDAVPLTKPKPVRRKKAESQLGGDIAKIPKQRGRKKVEPEPKFVIQGEPFDVISNQSPGQSEDAGLAVLPQEKETPTHSLEAPLQSDLPGVEDGLVPVAESGVKNDVPGVEIPQPVETQPGPDVQDSLWQTWLNRLNSVLAARSKRPTLVRNKTVIPEVESEASIVRAELPQESAEEKQTAPETFTQIVKEIGIDLRKQRELLSLHLDEVERNTHVKAHYLEALENGAMDDLPSTVQTRGMLSNYATFLDLDVDALLLRYADAVQARHRERNPQKPMRKPGQPILANMPPMSSFIAGDLIFGVGIVVLLVGFAIWGVSRVLTIQGQRDVQPTAPSISDILLASPDPSSFTATPTFLAVEAFPGEATVTVVIPTLGVDVNVQVNLVAVERTYMRVIVDGETAFEGRVVPGSVYPFEAVDQVEVLVGSGAAIRILYNGTDLGLLGTFGQVVNNIYRAQEIITPTGMPSPTETTTLTPTLTAVPTSTSRFTGTPVPSNTPAP
ncbi:MAG: RodZ domain-containing protein [Chloroflexota bacterium]